MKLKIYVYEETGKTRSDPYTEDEEIKEDYTDAKLFEYDMLESTIQEKCAEILKSYSNFKLTVLQNIDVLDTLVEFAHCEVKGLSAETERVEFLKQINKVARAEAIADLTEDFVNISERKFNEENFSNN